MVSSNMKAIYRDLERERKAREPRGAWERRRPADKLSAPERGRPHPQQHSLVGGQQFGFWADSVACCARGRAQSVLKRGCPQAQLVGAFWLLRMRTSALRSVSNT